MCFTAWKQDPRDGTSALSGYSVAFRVPLADLPGGTVGERET